ncbi:ectoine/hydroxyectoine ABC transporter permease subunit EhuC [Microbispora hainanensis]|uniref:Ectoine/hydroxyectoine ABC transporter permease subunit EhuC n=2 Tax=Microbispora hainanensis TaxID=568844 RepID=A0A544Z606_9ACTN|nr:ectoine/hydroxyectoine ABC transporter permease subunit EhuC [Microbispora hainanensis]
MPFLCDGTVITLQSAIGGSVIAIAIALPVGLMATSRHRRARAVARVYMEFFRGTSVLVQLFWLFYAMPLLTGFQLDKIFAGVLALGLNLGAYGSEVVRGAVRAVPRGQREAAVALNFSPFQRMRYVVLPQAFVEMVPPMNNLLIELLKATSLLSAITVADLAYEGRLLVNSGSDQLIVFALLLVIYFLLSYLITLLMRFVERRAARVVGRERPRRRAARTVEAAR